MKILRYGPPGEEKSGILDAENNVRDISKHVADWSGQSLLPSSLSKLSQIDASSLPHVDSDVRLGPPVAGVGKFICIGLNYSDHAAESE